MKPSHKPIHTYHLSLSFQPGTKPEEREMFYRSINAASADDAITFALVNLRTHLHLKVERIDACELAEKNMRQFCGICNLK